MADGTTDGQGATSGTADLTPSQLRTLAVLRRSARPVVFERDVVQTLVDEMTDALRDLESGLDEEDLYVSKHALGQVLDCETHFLAEDDFEWSATTAAGTVAHRAIELQLWWRGEPAPGVLVDEAIARLADEERGLGPWLSGLGPADDADLRARATERVTRFMEHFPPLPQRARPVTEARLRWPLAGRIILAGKVDLAFGAPAGDESRKVIVDLKTGSPSARHRQDVAFYALIETLISRVPPRKVATFYLDAADAYAEDVTVGLLRSAARRTLDGIDKMVALRTGARAPTTTAGFTCRWCPVSADCPTGRAWLDAPAER